MIPFSKISLRNKILILFLSIGIGSMIAVSIYYFKMNERAVLQRTFEQLTSVRVVKKRQLETFFNDRHREIELIASSADIKKIADRVAYVQIDKLKLSDFEFKLNSYLNDYLTSSGYMPRYFICSKNGNILMRNIDNPEDSVRFFKLSELNDSSVLKQMFRKVLSEKTTIVQDYNYDFSEHSEPGLFLATPILNSDNEFNNFFVLQISLSAINHIMLENSPTSGLGESGESYLVGDDFYMRSTSRFESNSVLKTRVKTIASTEALNNKTGDKIVDDYRGIKVFSSYSPLELFGLKWVILAEIDYAEAMERVYRARNDILYVSILLSMIIVGLSVFFSTQIISPIRKLKDATELVEKGNYDVNIELDSSDEVGKLVKAFNRMTQHIKKQTGELKDREERLSHFYRATTDGIFLQTEGKTMLVNKAMEILTGFSEQELMKKTFASLILKPTTVSFESNYEAILKRKDQTTFPVEVQEGVIDYKDKKIAAFVLRDITQRKKIEKALEQERENRISAVFDGQEQERQRISRELHDSLGQKMIALKLMLENISTDSIGDISGDMSKVKSNLDDLIEEVRQISSDIAPPVLSELGIENAIRQICRNLSQTSGVPVIFDSEGFSYKANQQVNFYLYRIAQEAITNAIKHSRATKIHVQLLESMKSIALIIEDNGVGFETENITFESGNGLFNMRERTKILNGRFEIVSGKNSGTLVNARVPKKNVKSVIP